MTTLHNFSFPEKIVDGDVTLILTHDELYFETMDNVQPDPELVELLRKHKLEHVRAKSSVFEDDLFNRAHLSRHWVRLLGNADPARMVAELLENSNVRLASPVYHRPDLPFKTGLTFADRILLKLTADTHTRPVVEAIEKTGVFPHR